jgi:hypothetical protein
MRWLSWRVVGYVVFLAVAVTASVCAAGLGRREPPQRYMNVGGVSNPCTCTQRLER